MMPGSLIDKTNNNLSNLACEHSDLTQNTDVERNILDFKNMSEVSISSTVHDTSSAQLIENTAQSDIDSQKPVVSPDTVDIENIPETSDSPNVTNAILVKSSELFDVPQSNDSIAIFSQNISEAGAPECDEASDTDIHKTVEAGSTEDDGNRKAVEQNIVAVDNTANNSSSETISLETIETCDLDRNEAIETVSQKTGEIGVLKSDEASKTDILKTVEDDGNKKAAVQETVADENPVHIGTIETVSQETIETGVLKSDEANETVIHKTVEARLTEDDGNKKAEVQETVADENPVHIGTIETFSKETIETCVLESDGAIETVIHKTVEARLTEDDGNKKAEVQETVADENPVHIGTIETFSKETIESNGASKTERIPVAQVPENDATSETDLQKSIEVVVPANNKTSEAEKEVVTKVPEKDSADEVDIHKTNDANVPDSDYTHGDEKAVAVDLPEIASTSETVAQEPGVSENPEDDDAVECNVQDSVELDVPDLKKTSKIIIQKIKEIDISKSDSISELDVQNTVEPVMSEDNKINEAEPPKSAVADIVVPANTSNSETEILEKMDTSETEIHKTNESDFPENMDTSETDVQKSIDTNNSEKMDISTEEIHNIIETEVLKTTEDNVPKTVEENVPKTVEENVLETVEEDILKTVEEHVPKTVEDNVPIIVDIDLPENKENNEIDTQDTHNKSVKKDTAITVKSKSKCFDKKIDRFLKKHNMSEEDLRSKLKNIKRHTKEKRTGKRVISLKLRRICFKNVKPKWSNRIPKKKFKKPTSVENKTQPDLIDTEITKPDLDNNEDEASEPEISNYDAENDIRNKIKQQLELLRQNRKPLSRNIESEEPQPSTSQKDTSTVVEATETKSDSSPPISKPIQANLSEVLLSNEGDLSIISVVGGYVSDEDTKEECPKEETINLTSENNKRCYSNLEKGTSITDMLLRREFTFDGVNLTVSHLITPTKTNDITKIKGWKSKQFAATENQPKIVESSLELKPNETEFKEEPKPECNIMKFEPSLVASSSLENPMPSTSSDFVVAVPKKTSYVQEDNILKQGEDITSEKNTKSAFVSDMLDTFLNNHAELKISYEVPKLVAEEAITKPLSEMPVTSNDYLSVVEKPSHKPKYQKKNVLKPKTLAEKRRMLEMDRKNKLLQDMETNEIMYLKRLEYCEKRNKIEIAKDIRDNLIAEEIPFRRHCWNMATKSDEGAHQFAVFNGQKIRIAGSSGGKDVVVVHEYANQTIDLCDSDDDATNDSFKSSKGGLSKRFSKLSIVNTDLTKPKFERPVRYKPGPLSKKRRLMRSSKTIDSWECHVLKMPKIKLVVYPEEGKRVPTLAEKYLQLCRSEKGFISNAWAQFAVSAVRCKEKTKTEVEFELPYANGQNKLLVRKLATNTPTEQSPIVEKKKEDMFPHINVEDSIKEIMSDMLCCIENQELDSLIIKNDPDLEDLKKGADNSCRPPSPINSMVQAIIKRPNARRSKTTLELRRLNVQVIEVDVKEDENEAANICTNDFCRLGCVCKSLRGTSGIVPEHCGRQECMLECSCSFDPSQRGHHSITLPAGTDLLSASTVVRLQDEVKRNLAKEEREFAQTVIKANNQTIMVGGGARERQRRVPKFPKKYSNYVQKARGLSYDKMISNGLLEEEEDPDKINSLIINSDKIKGDESSEVILEVKKPIPIWTKQENKKLSESSLDTASNIKVCRVKVDKLNLENVVPWCMVHNLYKCHCGGKALPIKRKPPGTKPSEEEAMNKSKTEEVEAEQYIAYAPRFNSRYQPEAPSVVVTDVTEKYCARTRALATNYYQARNKSQCFKARYAKIREDEVKTTDELKTSDELKEQQITAGRTKNKRKSEIIPQVDYSQYDPLAEQDLLTTKRPKKITVIDADELLNKLPTKPSAPVQPKPTNVEKKPETTDKGPCAVVPASSFIDYERSFLGILTPSEEWLKRFHKMLNLNTNTIAHQIRLLEWATLVKRQRTGIIQVWFNNKKYNNIILTEDRRRPSRSHMNIKLFNNTSLDKFTVPDIITSLLNNKLPGVAKKDTETYVILVCNGIDQWEARGTIVLNDTAEMCQFRLGHKPTPYAVLSRILQSDDPNKNRKPEVVENPPPLVLRSTPAMSVEVISTSRRATNTAPLRVTHEGLEITKVPLTTDDNTTSTMEQSAKQKQLSSKASNILVPLPTGTVGLSRWFMLILENDFSMLRISFSNFHIKYTHLTTAIQMAGNNRKTVRIRSQNTNTPESPGSFGIYAVPDYKDRIFFGPYGNDSDHGLETFRYVNGRLVNTKIYNKMRGSTERKTTGIWFTHSSTLNNNLNLEPQYDDNCSSSSDCSTEVTNADNAVKPQIEFVDLTGNDSDNETEEPPTLEKATIPTTSDPLFDVLSADFSKKIANDITIEPVYDTKMDAPKNPKITKKSTTMRGSNITITKGIKNSTLTITPIESTSNTERKRKSQTAPPQESPSKKQPKIIDSIRLDDDEMPVLEPYNGKNSTGSDTSNNNKQMPALCPITSLQSLRVDDFKNKNSSETKEQKQNVTYVITNIPGIGYFEIYFHKDKYCLRISLKKGQMTGFQSISMALHWLELMFKKFIFFVPSNMAVRFSILNSKETPAMSKFNENYLNGYHMMCEKGIFDLLTLSTNHLEKLGFTEAESARLLAHKCELLINRNIKVLGNYLVGPEEASKMDKAKILQIAPHKIKILESKESYLITEKNKLKSRQEQMIKSINSLLKIVPESVRTPVTQKLNLILRQTYDKTQTTVPTKNVNNPVTKLSDVKVNCLPAGKVCKILDGKIVLVNPPVVNMLDNEVSITKTPVTASSLQTKPYPVNLVSAAGMQNLAQTSANKDDRNMKFEMVVPITGLQTPVTVVGVSPTVQKKSSSASLLLSNQKKSAKVVDLTDE